MNFFDWLVHEVVEGRMSHNQAIDRIAEHHANLKSGRKAGNRTFNHLMQVRHRFGSGEKREHSTRLHRPAIWGRMSTYGI
jgi:hypothetical protein